MITLMLSDKQVVILICAAVVLCMFSAIGLYHCTKSDDAGCCATIVTLIAFVVSICAMVMM